MTLKKLIEQSMPGWSLVERSTQDGAVDASTHADESDFVARDIATVKAKFGLSGGRRAPEQDRASGSSEPEHQHGGQETSDQEEGESGLFKVRSETQQDDPVLSRKTVIVENGKITGVQG
jgi:hypothetical protein